jgi:26S proteasome regulatory subunit N6
LNLFSILSNLDLEKYHEALTSSVELMKQFKKMDDKMMLLEINLLQSKAYYALKNYSKSRASLTTARTFANAIYVPPILQAALDMQSGRLHCQDKDFKTGYFKNE